MYRPSDAPFNHSSYVFLVNSVNCKAPHCVDFSLRARDHVSHLRI
jgi:hypothetical protein